ISWSARAGSLARAAPPSNRGETGLHDPPRFLIPTEWGEPGSISMDSGFAFGAPRNDSETLCGLALMRGPYRAWGRRSPGVIGASGRRQVMVMTTAAAAATRMAMAAVSTVMEVAKVVISQSRRALNAPRWGGTVGIAGRETMECPPQRIRAGNAYGRLRAAGSGALPRRRGQECAPQDEERGRQPEPVGGQKEGVRG